MGFNSGFKELILVPFCLIVFVNVWCFYRIYTTLNRLLQQTAQFVQLVVFQNVKH